MDDVNIVKDIAVADKVCKAFEEASGAIGNKTARPLPLAWALGGLPEKPTDVVAGSPEGQGVQGSVGHPPPPQFHAFLT